MKDYEIFDLGDVKLFSGKILKSAKLTYKTYGSLNKKFDSSQNITKLNSIGKEVLFNNQKEIGKYI